MGFNQITSTDWVAYLQMPAIMAIIYTASFLPEE
jgi:hypothetical protein